MSQEKLNILQELSRRTEEERKTMADRMEKALEGIEEHRNELADILLSINEDIIKEERKTMAEKALNGIGDCVNELNDIRLLIPDVQYTLTQTLSLKHELIVAQRRINALEETIGKLEPFAELVKQQQELILERKKQELILERKKRDEEHREALKSRLDESQRRADEQHAERQKQKV